MARTKKKNQRKKYQRGGRRIRMRQEDGQTPEPQAQNKSVNKLGATADTGYQITDGNGSGVRGPYGIPTNIPGGGGGGNTTTPSEPVGDPAADVERPTAMTAPAPADVVLLADQPGITDPSEVITLGPGQATVNTSFTGGTGGGEAAPTATATTGTARTAGPATTAQAPTPIEAATYQAATISPEDVPTVQAAQGELSEGAIARVDEKELTERAVAAERDMAQEQAALTKQAAQYDISDGAYVDKVTGKVTEVAPTKEAEVAQREAILGKAARDGEAAQILETLNYEAAQVRQVKGTAAKGALLVYNHVSFSSSEYDYIPCLFDSSD